MKHRNPDWETVEIIRNLSIDNSFYSSVSTTNGMRPTNEVFDMMRQYGIAVPPQISLQEILLAFRTFVSSI